MINPSSSQVSKQIPEDQKITPIPRKIGIHSKRSFVFGIVSLVLSGIGLYLSSVVVYPSYYYYPQYIQIISQVIFSLVGLTCGIFAKSYGNEAEEFEASNKFQKAGKIMGLIGIIFGALGFVLTIMFHIIGFYY
ncbi:MAG: hypothetical protein ACFFBP_02920 [Promethearchaeota archaeon]